MDSMQTVYRIRIPMAGQPDGFYTLIRALSPETAGACLSGMLQTHDPLLTEVRIEIAKELVREGDWL